VALKIISNAQIAEQKKCGKCAEENEEESADSRFLFSLFSHGVPPERLTSVYNI
jgi:hypothetical protein